MEGGVLEEQFLPALLLFGIGQRPDELVGDLLAVAAAERRCPLGRNRRAAAGRGCPLLSNKASFVSGSQIVVDGGYLSVSS